jgi:hypothetical protein
MRTGFEDLSIEGRKGEYNEDRAMRIRKGRYRVGSKKLQSSIPLFRAEAFVRTPLKEGRKTSHQISMRTRTA